LWAADHLQRTHRKIGPAEAILSAKDAARNEYSVWRIHGGGFAMTDSKMKEYLFVAYGIIRQQTEQICDLQSLVVPLILALEPKYSDWTLREAYRRVQELKLQELSRSKIDSLALVDEAIRRLKDA